MAARAKKKTATKKKATKKTAAANNEQDKSIESWIWDAACSIRGAKDAPKYTLCAAAHNAYIGR
jgi:hypothetical protein